MNKIIQWLADHCQQHLLDEKWLLAEDLRIAQQWKDQLNRTGLTSINLHSKTLRSLVVSLVGNSLATRGLNFVNEATARMILHGLVRELLASGNLKYFVNVHAVDGLSALMTKSISDLRLAQLQPQMLNAQSFESTSKGLDVQRIFAAYCRKLDDLCIVDYAACLQLATEGIENGSFELPQSLLVLVPETLDFTTAEQRLIEALGKRAILCRPQQLDSFSAESTRHLLESRVASGTALFHYFCGYGEVNEVRGVVQRVLSRDRGGPHSFDDVEILHTDYQQYVPLCLELLSTWLSRPALRKDINQDENLPSVDSLPITFAEGIACVYSRPGRALRGWLRWARHDFMQAKGVQLLREGLLARPQSTESHSPRPSTLGRGARGEGQAKSDSPRPGTQGRGVGGEGQIGYARLANTLRRIPIGFKAERYLPKINETIRLAEQRLLDYEAHRDLDDTESHDEAHARDFGLPALLAVEAMLEPLIALAPRRDESAITILEKSRQFLIQCVRADSTLDRYARGKLLDDVNGLITNLSLVDDTALDVWLWLEELPLESRILASGPRPGCMHVAPLAQGGHSGRRQLFIMGLDDGRFPKRATIDPILLDAERNHLSKALQTSQAAAQHQQQALARALFRVLSDADANVHFSYSTKNLAEDRLAFPSSSLLEMYRITEQDADAHSDDLLNHMGAAVSFVSENPDDHLDESDTALAQLLSESLGIQRRQMLEDEFPHLERRRMACEFQAAPQFSEYDGWVPSAGMDLDPAGSQYRVSPSRLETFGACPRRFFFKYGLGIYPPDEWSVDPEKWLDALQFGNLVHELFEDFLRGLTKHQLIPNFIRDRQLLQDILYAKIELLKSDIPIPNEDVLRRQCDLLEDVCEVFLRKEEEYCLEHQARPWVLEASIGLQDEPQTELDCREPIALTLSDGRVIRVGGRIDRVDRLMLHGSERYAIWDYKSGTDFGFKQEDPFRQGRKLQPYLYVGMLRHRLAAIGGDADKVASFGYFFPNPRTEGLKLQWMYGELKRGDDVLRQICDLIKSGVFMATTDSTDCNFCDYLAVCKYPDFVAAQSLRKSLAACNKKLLQPWRHLRELDELEQDRAVEP